MNYIFGWMLKRSKTYGLLQKIVILAFFLVQCLDGIVTYHVINKGLAFEANPLVNWLMSLVGVGLGVTMAKTFAISLGIMLFFLGAGNMLTIITALYLIILTPLFIPFYF